MKKVINRKKVLAILMTMVLMFVGTGYIHAEEGTTEENVSSMEVEYKVGMVKIESILELYPDTQDLYVMYQEELAQLETDVSAEENGEEEVAGLEELNQKYIVLLTDKIQDDLDQFTYNLGLDVLLIDNTIVSGDKDLNPEDFSEIIDVTQYLGTYLEESNSATSTEELDSTTSESTEE